MWIRTQSRRTCPVAVALALVTMLTATSMPAVAVPVFSLSPSASTLGSGESLAVDVYVEDVDALRLFEVGLELYGPDGGSLDLVDLLVDQGRPDFVFAGMSAVATATDAANLRMTCTPLDGGCVRVPAGVPAYLGTYLFRANTGTTASFSLSFDDAATALADCDGTAIESLVLQEAGVDVVIPEPSIWLSPNSATIERGESVTFDVFVENAARLRLYEIVLDVHGPPGAAMDLVSLEIDEQRSDFVFAGLASLACVPDPSGLRIVCTPLDGDVVDVPAGVPAYLGTYTFVANTTTLATFDVVIAAPESSYVLDGDGNRITPTTVAGAAVEVTVPDPVVFLAPSATSIGEGQTVNLDVFVQNIDELKAFDVAWSVEGGSGGTLDVADISVDQQRADFVFSGMSDLACATDPAGMKFTCTPLSGSCAHLAFGTAGYLGTVTFVAHATAGEVFDVHVRAEPATFLVDCDGASPSPLAHGSSSVTTVEVQDLAPVAECGGPYQCFVGADTTWPCRIDGCQSYDPDEALGDHITSYGWELDFEEPYDFDEASQCLTSYTWDAEGTYSIGLRVVDDPDSGLSGAPRSDVCWTTVEIDRDTGVPATSIAISPQTPDGDNGWYVTMPTVTLTAVDAVVPGESAAGVCEIHHASGDADWSIVEGDVAQLGLDDGAYDLNYYAIDCAGNEETVQVYPVLVDHGPPNAHFDAGPGNGTVTNETDVTFCWSGTDVVVDAQDLEFSYCTDTACDPSAGPFGSQLCHAFETLTEGVYTIKVTARDPAGHVDATPAARTFMVDLTPPRIVRHVPSGFVSDPLTHIDVTFDEQMDAGSISLVDFAMTDSEGEAVVLDALQYLGGHVWRLTFAAQTMEGTYCLTVLPTVTDEAGNRLDADGDGIGGEWPDDAYEACVSIDARGPFVVEHQPSGVASEPVTYVDVTFSEPVVAGACVAGDIVLRDPDGVARATEAPVSLTDTVWRVGFGQPVEDGEYCLHVSPCFADLAGNVMDQDEDGLPGEEPDDVYVGCFANALPNLVVELVDAPAAAMFGEDITVEWTARNAGEGFAAVGWQDGVYLSRDAELDDDDTLLATEAGPEPPIGADETYVRSFVVSLPFAPELVEDTYHVLVVVDAEGVLVESDEDDNVAPRPVDLEFAPFPDLALLDGLDMPAQASTGATIAVSWVVSNSGDLPAEGAWVDRLYFSTDDQLDVDTDEVVTLVAGPGMLQPGRSYQGSALVTLPEASGGYWLIALLDANNDIEEGPGERNNLYVPVEPLVVLPQPRPDLLVTEVVADEEAVAGGPINVTWTVTNDGEAPAQGAWYDRVYASIDTALGGDDVLLSVQVAQVVDVGASYTRAEAFDLPYDLDGVYHILVVADANDRVEEGDWEHNNVGYAEPPTAIVQPSLPDLVPDTFDVPSVAYALTDVAVAWTVANQGALSADGVWHDYIYLSSDGEWDAADPRIGMFPRPIPLQPEGMYAQAPHLRMPAETGVYWLMLQVNGDSGVEEGTGRDNNVMVAGPIEILPHPRPDLVVRDIVLPTPSPAGDTVVLSWSEANVSTVTAVDTWVTKVLASPDGDVGDDTVLATFLYEDNVLGQDDDPIVRTEEIPVPNFRNGYHVVVCIDSTDLVLEDDNVNNCTITQAAAVVVHPDLDVTAVAAPPTAIADGVADVSWTVRNVAFASAQGTWVDTVYLSEDTVLDENDRLVATAVHNGPLPPMQSYTVNWPVRVPGRLGGDYYFFVVTDGAGLLVEGGDDANNTERAPDVTVIIQPPRPNLEVTHVQTPADGLIGMEFVARWTVENTGGGDADGGWYDHVLARPLGGDDPDILLDIVEHTGGLAQGGAYAGTATVTHPGPAGMYELVVVTDHFDAEPDEPDYGGAVNEGVAGGEEDNEGRSDVFETDTYVVNVSTDVEHASAGTPSIALSGFASPAGAPNERLAGVPVEIHVRTQDTVRVLPQVGEPPLLTDDEGNYTVNFVPFSNEAGMYTLLAGPPGNVDPVAQDTFYLWGIRANPATGSARLYGGQTLGGEVVVRNLGDQAVTGVTAIVEGAPQELGFVVDLASDFIAGRGTSTATFAVAPDLHYVSPSDVVTIRFSSNEAPDATTVLTITTDSVQPALQLRPAELAGEMVRGRQTLVELHVANVGAVPATALQVFLPSDAPWLQLGTQAIPDLAPGASATLLLHLLPPDDMPLDLYTGSITVGDAELTYGQSVPFRFQATSDQRTNVTVAVKDEATFWSTLVYVPEGGPLVPDATVQLLHPLTHEVLFEGYSSPDGVAEIVEFVDVTEGAYKLRVVAPHHASFMELIAVEAGRENHFDAFLPTETVQYSWTVTETDIEDITLVTLTVLFETNVPTPVVTVDPPMLDLSTIDGDATQIDFTVLNTGLIAAEDVAINFGTHPDWTLTPLVEEIGTLLPGEENAQTVPVLIERRTRGPDDPPLLREVPCTIQAGVDWALVCIGTTYYRVPILVFRAHGDCGVPSGGGGGGGGSWHGGGGHGGPGEPFVVQTTPGQPQECEECDPETYTPTQLGCLDMSALFGPAETAIEGYITANTGGWISPTAEITAEGCLETCCDDGGLGLNGTIDATAELELALVDVDLSEQIGGTFPLEGGFTGTAQGTASVNLNLSATPWISAGAQTGCNLSEPELHASAGIRANASADVDVNGDASISGPDGEEITGAHFDAFAHFRGRAHAQVEWSSVTGTTGEACFDGMYLDWGMSFSASGQGSWTAEECERIWIEQPIGTANCPPPPPCGEGVASVARRPLPPLTDDIFLPTSREELQRELYRLMPDTICHYRMKPVRRSTQTYLREDDGVCARVRLQLQQEIAITRTAFEAALEITNPPSLSPVEDLFATVDVYDLEGNLVSDAFLVSAPDMFNVSAVDGTGVIATNTLGRITWLIIPTHEAAPMEPVEYRVGGMFMYSQDGISQVVELEPVAITVQPDPRLFLKYFWQRDVFADDPHTEVVEPSEPFSLGLIMSNEGYGTARNVRITTSQPTIIENERHLLIAFELIGTQIGADVVTPALNVTLGDILPFTSKVVRWLMTSTLHGQFVEYDAQYENITGLGDPRVSLIDGVDIFELIHVVRSTMPVDDLIPDFMTNEVAYPDDPLENPDEPDRIDLPDTLHTSDGAVEPVTTVMDAVVTPDEQQWRAVVSLPPHAGYVYVKTADPFEGRYRLSRAVRDDNGRSLPIEFNAWQTDRTFIEGGEQPVRQHRMHLFDYDPASSYTLHFAQAALTPDAPSIYETTATTVQIGNLGTRNQSGMEHAVFDEATGMFVGPDDSLRAAPFWKARDAWIGVRVRSLRPETEYRFKSRARLGNAESTFGPATTATTSIPGDVDGDGIVTPTDLTIVNQAVGTMYGEKGFDARADVTGNGAVNQIDLWSVAILLGRLGDLDSDGDIDLDDHALFYPCVTGPADDQVEEACVFADLTGNGTVDLKDIAVFQREFEGRQ